MTEQDVADVLRVVGMVAGSMVLALAGFVVVLYGRLYLLFHRDLPRRVRWRGLLPRHVTTIGLAHILLVVGTVIEMASRIHDGITWRPFVYLLAYALGMWALWDVLGHERARYLNIRPIPDPGNVLDTPDDNPPV